MIDLAVQLDLASFQLAVSVRLEAATTALVGPSGAGKTSLLELLAGMRRGSGRIVVAERVLQDTASDVLLPPEARRIGYVPQDALLFPHLSVAANIKFASTADPRSVDKAVELLELGPLLQRHPRSLSGGERQRVAIARALAANPTLLLLDEPLANLDYGLRSRILPYLLALREHGNVPLIYVTHNLGEARLLCDDALVLRAGKVVAHGPCHATSVLSWAGNGETELDNVLAGKLVATDRDGGLSLLEVSPELVLSVPSSALSPGERAVVRVSADDVLVLRQPHPELSARNVFWGVVHSLAAAGDGVLVEISASGFLWLARLTPAAVRQLGLSPNQPAAVAIKAHSVRPCR